MPSHLRFVLVPGGPRSSGSPAGAGDVDRNRRVTAMAGRLDAVRSRVAFRCCS
jgi:hypothetical protein